MKFLKLKEHRRIERKIAREFIAKFAILLAKVLSNQLNLSKQPRLRAAQLQVLQTTPAVVTWLNTTVKCEVLFQPRTKVFQLLEFIIYLILRIPTFQPIQVRKFVNQFINRKFKVTLQNRSLWKRQLLYFSEPAVLTVIYELLYAELRLWKK
jgi:hypothetical protein